MRLLALLSLTAWSATIALACSGSPSSIGSPTEAVSAAATSSAPAASETPSANTAAPQGPFGGSASSPAQGPPPTAKVIGTAPSKESALYLHVEVLFDNQSSRACRIDGYVLTWPGGKKVISIENFSVPSKEQKKRSVKVHSDDGDLSTLTADKASIALKTDCAP
jgi:hypothetical protein